MGQREQAQVVQGGDRRVRFWHPSLGEKEGGESNHMPCFGVQRETDSEQIDFCMDIYGTTVYIR